VNQALVERYDRRLPRYTSYPAAPHFKPIKHAEVAQALSRVAGAISLYVHIPFCKQLCWYCGCHREIVQGTKRTHPYVDGLLAELDLVCAYAGGLLRIEQLALGGGSPNSLDEDQLAKLMGGIRARMPVVATGACSVELDPRSMSPRMAEHLVTLGFDRFSMGVQDLDEAVMAAVNRPQSAALVERVLGALRVRGNPAINIDLMVGLPLQTAETITATVRRVAGWATSQVTLFPYAHVPWMQPQQKHLERVGLPGREERKVLRETATRLLVAAGYQQIGMDHFARPSDALVRARDSGRLHRNFQGYTTRPDLEMVGVGTSAIGYCGGAYMQNTKDQATWYEALAAGRLPVERGHVMSDDDVVRRQIILALLCRGGLRWDDLGLSSQAFTQELDRLRPLADDGLLRIRREGLTLTARGKGFARNVAAVFDQYMTQDGPGRYSRTT
jgi:oxygen-independent coproporphyrinogen III oxidase